MLIKLLRPGGLCDDFLSKHMHVSNLEEYWFQVYSLSLNRHVESTQRRWYLLAEARICLLLPTPNLHR